MMPLRPSLRLALAAGALTGAVVLGTVLPSRAQQNLPTLRPTAPATRQAGRLTRVDLDFTLPTGFRLFRNPRFRVIDARDRIVELLPITLTQRPPTGQGFRRLHTGAYRPGVYRLRAECDYVDASGARGTVVTPWSTLTVPTP
jgi:hypothetical protein